MLLLLVLIFNKNFNNFSSCAVAYRQPGDVAYNQPPVIKNTYLNSLWEDEVNCEE